MHEKAKHNVKKACSDFNPAEQRNFPNNSAGSSDPAAVGCDLQIAVIFGNLKIAIRS